MAVINVPGMHCVKCVERITKALENEGIKAAVSLENKTVTVNDTDARSAAEAIDDIGFECSLK